MVRVVGERTIGRPVGGLGLGEAAEARTARRRGTARGAAAGRAVRLEDSSSTLCQSRPRAPKSREGEQERLGDLAAVARALATRSCAQAVGERRRRAARVEPGEVAVEAGVVPVEEAGRAARHGLAVVGPDAAALGAAHDEPVQVAAA